MSEKRENLYQTLLENKVPVIELNKKFFMISDGKISQNPEKELVEITNKIFDEYNDYFEERTEEVEKERQLEILREIAQKVKTECVEEGIEWKELKSYVETLSEEEAEFVESFIERLSK